MFPVIAIIGRPNVGKSTLFNRLTKTRDALVADLPGLTRDRQYGEAILEASHRVLVIDTGGLAENEGAIDASMTEQTYLALEEADLIYFMVSARDGVTNADRAITNELRKINKPVLLLVNKIDGIDIDITTPEFYELGFDQLYPIASSHGRGFSTLIEATVKQLSFETHDKNEAKVGIQLAIIGRPNVGKSTLVNCLLGEKRVVVFDDPGTTRDAIKIPLEHRGQAYTLIDTAGVRRRGRIKETVEKFSIIKTMQAIEQADVVLMLIDAQEGATDQDCHLIDFALTAGRAVVLAINKCDDMSAVQKTTLKNSIEKRLAFIDFVPQHRISALHGTGVGHLFESIQKVYQAATKNLTTSMLTDILIAATQAHPLPLVRQHRIKLRYAHCGGHLPPTIIIHGNQTKEVPEHYKKYLVNFYRDALKLPGTPIRLIFKSSDNPFKHIRNKLTPRQLHKRRRTIRRFKPKGNK